VDNPAALQDTLIEVLHITDTQFSSFYSFYNWPNSILCIINGYIIDRILGCRLAIILFTLLMTIGQIIFAFGAYSNEYIVMVVGRAVFG
jgi:dipeptide/tripeptide permease